MNFSRTIVKDIELNVETMEAKILAKRPPYIPIHVFKILTKIGCSFLPKNELDDFANTFKFLLAEHKSNEFKGMDMFSIQMYFIPGPILCQDPILILFKRKKEAMTVPSRLVVLHYKNLVMQSIIPFCKQDSHLYEKQSKVSIPIYPLIIPEEWFENYGRYRLHFINMSSSDKVYNEGSAVGMKLTNLQIL